MAAENSSSIVSKCILLIDILSEARRPLRFSEIVAQSGFVKSSGHRVLAILVNERLVEYDDAARTYSLGPKLIDWARTAWRRTDIQQAAMPELEALCAQTGMNVALSVRDDDLVMYLRTFDSTSVRYASRAGQYAPLHCTAVGKIYLAHMPDLQRAQLIARLRMERFTEFTINDPESLLAEVDLARERGFATCFQEEFLQVLGVAAPIRNADGLVCAGVSLWGLIEDFGKQDLLDQVPALKAAAARISRQMGHQPS
ncbi:MAG: IclR family transcriptional regulator [Pikeienuella sp.]